MVKNPPAIQEPEFNPWVRKIPWRKVVVQYKMIKSTLGFPSGSVGRESACSARDLGLIPCLGRSLGERNSYPLQYSSLENPMDCTVQGIAKSWTLLSNFHLTLLQSQTTASLLSYPQSPQQQQEWNISRMPRSWQECSEGLCIHVVALPCSTEH